MPKRTPRRRGWHVVTGYTCDHWHPRPAFRPVDERVVGEKGSPWECLDIGTVLPSLEEYFKAHSAGGACSDAMKIRVEIRISRLRWTPEELAEFGARCEQGERDRRDMLDEFERTRLNPYRPRKSGA